MVMGRYLDEIEQLFMDVEIEARATLEYKGNLDDEALRIAFAYLCTRYPVLKGHIKDCHGKHRLTVDDSTKFLFKVIDGNKDTLLEHFSTPEPLPPGEFGDRPVSSLTVVRDQSHGYIVFSLHHCVCDGTALFEYLRELWTLYTHLADDRKPVAEEGESLPAPPTQLLRNRWGDPGTLVDSSLLSKADQPMREGICRRIQLTREETKEYISRARSGGNSVASFTLGEAVSSLRHYNPLMVSKELVVSTTVDLRSYLRPPIEATESTYVCGACTIYLPQHVELGQIGAEFDHQVKEAIAERNILIQGYTMSGNRPDLFPDIVINNVRSIPKLAVPDGLELIDFFDPRQLARANTAIPVPEKQLLYIHCLTFNERLTMEIIGPLELTEAITGLSESVRMKLTSYP